MSLSAGSALRSRFHAASLESRHIPCVCPLCPAPRPLLPPSLRSGHIWPFHIKVGFRRESGGRWEKGQGQRGSNGDRRSISLSDSVVIVWSYSGESAAAPALDIACLDFPRACCCWVRSLSRCLPLYLSAVCPPPVSLPHLQQENKHALLPVDFFLISFYNTRKDVHSEPDRKQPGNARRQRFTLQGSRETF